MRALPCQTCPIVPRSIRAKTLHHQKPGLNTWGIRRLKGQHEPIILVVLFDLATAMFQKAWDARRAQAKETIRTGKRQIAALDRILMPLSRVSSMRPT